MPLRLTQILETILNSKHNHALKTHLGAVEMREAGAAVRMDIGLLTVRNYYLRGAAALLTFVNFKTLISMNDLEKMSHMAKNNQDIRMSGQILNIDSGKKIHKVTMQVDEDTAQAIMRGIATGKPTHYVALYVINKEQFDILK